MFQDETQPENQLERLTPLPSQPASQDAEVQRKRMLIALGILLVALVAVVLKDWDFWFPPSEDVQEAAAPRKTAGTALAAAAARAPVPSKGERQSDMAAEREAAARFRASGEGTVLPTLQVEVVAGNRHTKV